MTQSLLPEPVPSCTTAGEPPQPEVEGFRVVRWLGSGAAADVWLVADANTGTEYALKLFTRDDGGAPDGSGEGKPEKSSMEPERERLLLESVVHDHLLPALRIIPTNAGDGLLLQYAAGGSLASLVAARGPLSVAETVTVLTPLAQALAYLHAQGMTHGDVAPGNVLFTELGKPLLSDFGIARLVGSAKLYSGGTPGFCPPEVSRGSREGHGLEPDADVYALAALGWYMLTGRVPARTVQRPPLGVMVPGVPAALVELLEAGLSEAPGERPRADDFARRAYRTAAPEPVDLTAAVHPSVTPKLLTRRVVRHNKKRRGMGLGSWRARLPRRLPVVGRQQRKAGRTMGRPSTGARPARHRTVL
ncbi:serine/threonine protein kinase, partial [Arthrobacter crystallopoietes BAB-32]